MSATRSESVRFLYYAMKRVRMAAGVCEEEAHSIADDICFAPKQGKLNQGLGVYEALDIPLQLGVPATSLPSVEEALSNCQPRPGHSVRVPGSKAYEFLQQGRDTVEVLTNHWDPFFVNIAGRYGLNEEQLRADFNATQVA